MSLSYPILVDHYIPYRLHLLVNPSPSSIGLLAIWPGEAFLIIIGCLDMLVFPYIPGCQCILVVSPYFFVAGVLYRSHS